MTPRERILEALSGNRPEIPPVGIFTQSATVGMMETLGSPWPLAHTNANKMAALGCAQAEEFGFGTIRVPFDITAEAERLGCGVEMGSMKDAPSISSRVIPDSPMDGPLPDVDLMSPSEFVSGGRPMVIDRALRLCSESIGDTHAIVGSLLGPVSLLGQMMGAENMAMATLLCPEWAERMCTRLSAILAEYGKAQRDAGADVITMVESVASPDVLDPANYWRLSGSRFSGIMPKGVKSVLHICGSTEPILEDITRTGADAMSPDSKVSPSDVRSALGNMAVVGAVDPVGTLLLGTPAKVRTEARMYADAGYAVIAPGCGLAPLTPDANLMALANAFRS